MWGEFHEWNPTINKITLVTFVAGAKNTKTLVKENGMASIIAQWQGDNGWVKEDNCVSKMMSQSTINGIMHCPCNFEGSGY